MAALCSVYLSMYRIYASPDETHNPEWLLRRARLLLLLDRERFLRLLELCEAYDVTSSTCLESALEFAARLDRISPPRRQGRRALA